jgi:hypothetical protein
MREGRATINMSYFASMNTYFHIFIFINLIEWAWTGIGFFAQVKL